MRKELVLEVTKIEEMAPPVPAHAKLYEDAGEPVPELVPHQDTIFIPVREIDSMRIVMRESWDGKVL